MLGTPTVTRGKSKADLAAVCLFIAPNAKVAGYPTKNVFISKILKDTFVSPSQSRDIPASYDVKHGDTKVSL